MEKAEKDGVAEGAEALRHALTWLPDPFHKQVPSYRAPELKGFAFRAYFKHARSKAQRYASTEADTLAPMLNHFGRQGPHVAGQVACGEGQAGGHVHNA